VQVHALYLLDQPLVVEVHHLALLEVQEHQVPELQEEVVELGLDHLEVVEEVGLVHLEVAEEVGLQNLEVEEEVGLDHLEEAEEVGLQNLEVEEEVGLDYPEVEEEVVSVLQAVVVELHKRVEVVGVVP